MSSRSRWYRSTSRADSRASFVGLLIAACCVLPACPSDPEVDSSMVAARRRLSDGYKAGTADIDIFGDGKAHVRRQFQGGTAVRTEVTYNGAVVTTEEVVGAKRIMTFSPDGKPLRRFESTPLAGGGQAVVLTLFALDDTEPHRRLSFEEHPTVATVQITEEEDSAHDGSFSETRGYEAHRGRRDVTVTPGASSNCGAGQAGALKTAIEEALDKGSGCLASLKPMLATAVLAYVAAHSIDVVCGGSNPDVCGEFISTGGGNGTIVIFSGQGGRCGSLASLVFHEILHADGLFNRHGRGDGDQDPTDPVYGCEATCFGTATSLSCAACIGVANGTGACAKLPYKACPQFYCGCTQTFYELESACVDQCGTGADPFGCAFGGICGPPPGLVCR